MDRTSQVQRLRAELQAREETERERRQGHEEEFKRRLLEMEKSRDEVDEERAKAVGELRRLTVGRDLSPD